MTDDTVRNLDDVADVLANQGYEYRVVEGAVQVKIGGAEHPFVGVITANEADTELRLTCRIARLGDIPEGNIPQFFAACLDANTRILPFAFGMITAADNPQLDHEQDWPIVLVDSIPLGDLSVAEFENSLEKLWMALEASREVMSNALGEAG